MFKRGVITDEISQDLKEAIELATRYHLDGIEVRSVWEKSPHEWTLEEVKKVRSMADDAGLEICGISAPFFKCNLDDPKEVKQHLEILKKSMEAAHILNAPFIRGFTFWNKGDFDSKFNKIIDQFQKPIEWLEKEDLTLVLEFDPSVYATNARKLAKVIAALNSKYVKGLWDPGNDIYDPDGEVPYPDGYEYIKQYMVHMHLKDAKIGENGKPAAMPIGDGQVDYKGHFNELIDSGYNGYVVLETHYRPKHDLSESLLALPKGSAFSYLGYEATEECLQKWNKLMTSL